MAISVTLLSNNDRGMIWKYTGDGTTAASSAVFPQKLAPSLTIASVQAISYPATKPNPTMEVVSGAAGLAWPTEAGFTTHTISSSSVNTSTGVVSATKSAAVSSGRIAFVCVVFNHEAN